MAVVCFIKRLKGLMLSIEASVHLFFWCNEIMQYKVELNKSMFSG